ncbi:MAG: hypothetical protein KDD50_14705 [Bdellovibrionales bacterium]|nr:hypothetical protein [Bdellovibrionales bacterium]
MKTLNRNINKLIFGFLLLSTVMFTGCDKNNGNNNVVVGARPGVNGYENCTTCPTTTNHLVDALGLVKAYTDFQAELGLGFYTDANVVQNGNPVGTAATVAGYMFVDKDVNQTCYLREGHYNIETAQAGTVYSGNSVTGLKFVAVHQGTGERVYMNFDYGIYWNSMSPTRVSKIDGIQYGHSLSGWLTIERIEGPQVNCNAFGRKYLIEKPYY